DPDRIVDRQIVLAGHRFDFLTNVLPGTNKDGIDHRFGREARLADQIPKALIAPQPAHAIYWKSHFFSVGPTGRIATVHRFAASLPPPRPPTHYNNPSRGLSVPTEPTFFNVKAKRKRLSTRAP